MFTGAGLIDASVVKVDAANDLALLKASGAFKPLPIAASRTVKLGGTVVTVGFPDSPLALWDGCDDGLIPPPRRTMLGDDGNQIKADGNSFPVFILGWTIGAIGV